MSILAWLVSIPWWADVVVGFAFVSVFVFSICGVLSEGSQGGTND